MEGILFYWTAWIFWTLTTFFMIKTQARTIMAACILIAIILSSVHINIAGFQINMASLFLYATTLVCITQKKMWESLYIFISAFIVILAYASFLLFELFDPVWVIFNRDWMLSAVLIFLCIFLHSDKPSRYFTLFAGSLQGELLFSIALKNSYIAYQIGGFSFLDTLSIAMIGLLLWNLMESIAANLEQYFTQHGRGKHKTT